MSLEPAAPQSRVKHSTTEPLHSLITKVIDSLFKYNGKCAQFAFTLILEHVHQRKMACHAEPQILYLQMMMLNVDSV